MSTISRMAIVGAVVVLASGCATYRVHPDFKARHQTLHTVTCLPPDVQVQKVTFTGAYEPMHELYPQVKEYTVAALQQIFEKKGYWWQPLDFSEEALQQDPELRTTLYTLQKVYEEVLKGIAKRQQKRFTYTLGSEVNLVADRANADALLLVKWQAYKKSGGEIAKDVVKSVLIAAATLGSVIAIAPTSEAMASVALIDGNTGDVLWYHTNINTAVDVAQARQVQRTIDRILQPFPKSSAKRVEEEVRRQKAKSRMRPEAVPTSPPAPIPQSP